MKTSITILILSSVLGAFFYDIIDDFISNKAQFLPIILAVITDAIFSSIKHLKRGTFKTSKSLLFTAKIASFGALLYVIIKMEQGYDYIDWLSEAIMIPILVSQLLSILKHWYELGIISGKLFDKILQNIDQHKTGTKTSNEDNIAGNHED